MTEKNKSETVVGRKVKNPTPTPTPKPTPSPSLSGVTSGINGRLSEIGIVVSGTETMDTVSDFLLI